MADSYLVYHKYDTGDQVKVKIIDRGDGTYAMANNATMDPGDISIGAVEVKDATTADRMSVSAAGAAKVDGSAVTQPISISVPANSSRSDTFTATGNGATVDISSAPVGSFAIQVKATGSVTSWDVRLEGSLNGSDFTTLLTHTNVSPGDGLVQWPGAIVSPCKYFRSRCSGLVLGPGTNVVASIVGVM